MGDRIAVLRKGVLQQLGTPEELYDAPANLFVAEFIGSPPMNVVSATVVRGSELVVGSQRLTLPAGALDGLPSLAGGRRPGRPGAAPGEPARRRRRRPVVAAPGRRRAAGRERAAGEAGAPADRRRAGRHRRHPGDRQGRRRRRRGRAARARQGLGAQRPPARDDRRPRGHPRGVRPRRRRRCTSSTRPPATPTRTAARAAAGPRDRTGPPHQARRQPVLVPGRVLPAHAVPRGLHPRIRRLRRPRDRDHPRAVDPRLPAPDRRVRRHLVRLDGEVRDDAGRHRPLPRHQAATPTAG